MFLVQRFKEIFSVNLENIYDKLVAGLKKSIQNAGSNYEVVFDHFRGGGKSTMYSHHQNQLYGIGMQEIKLYEERQRQKRWQEIINLLMNDYKALQYKFTAEKYFEYEFSEFPFLNYISGENFINLIKRNDNAFIKFLKNLFKKRYINSVQFEVESSSLDTFFNSLNEYAKELSEAKGNKVRIHLIIDLLNTLSEIIQKFEKKVMNQVMISENESD